MKKTALALAPALAFVVLAAGACASSSESESAAPSVASSSSVSSSSSSSGMPFVLDKATASYDGVAQEVLQVPSYTYVAVKTDGGDVRWAVSLKKRELHEGARVHVRSFGEKEHFESKKLGRTFDRLSFAVIHTEES